MGQKDKPRMKRKLRTVYIGFLSILIVAAVSMNLIYMVYYSLNARKLDETERARTLGQTVFYTNRYMKEVEDGANMLSISSTVQKLMTYRIKKDYLDYAAGMELLSEYAMAIPGIYRIDLLVRSNSTLITSYEGVYYDLTPAESRCYQEYLEADQEWIWDTDYAGQEPNLVSQNRNEHYISLIKPVYSKYSGRKAGVLCISVQSSEFEKMLPMENSEDEGILIFNKGKSILPGSFGWSASEQPGDTSAKYLSQVSDYSGMEFIYYYTPQFGVKGSMTILISTLVITAFFAVIFLCIVEISERKMFQPVTTLLHGFEEVEQGKFDIHLDENRKDLFREIFIRFNHMAETLKQMIEELSNERTRRNEFKFRLLQMQIKPHFLYNLFNNMVWMMEQKDYEKLERLIESTAGYYKTALNYGNQDIMLIENQKQLEYYVEIQKIRFGNIFTFQVYLEDEVQFYSIPNLLLQPLVENAIVHGLKGKEQEVTHIEMTAETVDDKLIITVEDDGCGIPSDTLADIQKEMENYEGDGSRYFALVNVTARLHNRYKGRANVQIESQVERGTIVTVEIPLEEVK